MDRNKEIGEALRQIERDNDVKVLLASESGSRAWGFSSPDSDWDVRFIYVPKSRWYYSMYPQKDTIELMLAGGELDLSGWELRKSLLLLSKTNPGMSDWLHSPIIYEKEEDTFRQFLDLEQESYDAQKSIFHFYAMYKKHNDRYLIRDEGRTLKRFLYYLRGLLAGIYVEQYRYHPPILFENLVEETVHNEEIKARIKTMLEKKRKSREHDHDSIDPLLLEYGKQLESHIEGILSTMHPAKSALDNGKLTDFLMKTVYRYDD